MANRPKFKGEFDLAFALFYWCDSLRRNRPQFRQSGLDLKVQRLQPIVAARFQGKDQKLQHLARIFGGDDRRGELAPLGRGMAFSTGGCFSI